MALGLQYVYHRVAIKTPMDFNSICINDIACSSPAVVDSERPAGRQQQ